MCHACRMSLKTRFSDTNVAVAVTVKGRRGGRRGTNLPKWSLQISIINRLNVVSVREIRRLSSYISQLNDWPTGKGPVKGAAKEILENGYAVAVFGVSV